jgi:hypothetical protein
MRTLLLAASAALALTSVAHAQGPSQQTIAQGPTAQAMANPTSTSSAASNASTGAATASAGGATLVNAYQRDPVSSALAAPLTFSQGTCFVSASAGGQGVTLGLSLAVPFEDKACTARATAQALNALGERAAALKYLAAHDAGVRAALAAN